MDPNTQDHPAAPLSTAESNAYAYVSAAASDARTDGDPLELRRPVAAVLERMLDELIEHRAARRPLDRGVAGIAQFIGAARATGYTIETEDGDELPAASLAEARDLVEASIVAVVLGQPIDDPDVAGALADLTASLEALRRLAGPGPDLERALAEGKKAHAARGIAELRYDELRTAAARTVTAAGTMNRVYLEPGSVGEELGRAIHELDAQVNG